MNTEKIANDLRKFNPDKYKGIRHITTRDTYYLKLEGKNRGERVDPFKKTPTGWSQFYDLLQGNEVWTRYYDELFGGAGVVCCTVNYKEFTEPKDTPNATRLCQEKALKDIYEVR